MDHAVLVALSLTVLAGMATTVGGVLAVSRRLRGGGGLAVALAFAAGAMVFVTFGEILPKTVDGFAGDLGVLGAWVAVASLIAVGMVVVGGLTRALDALAVEPSQNPGSGGDLLLRRQMRRSGIIIAVAVAAHNLPEGLGTFVAALEDPRAGLVLAVAIAIHNIPEGMAVAAPVYAASGDRLRAVGWAAASGLVEPVGALVGLLLVSTVLPASAYALVYGIVGGMMLRISVTELLPAARRLATGSRTFLAMSAGAAVMTLSLILLRFL